MSRLLDEWLKEAREEAREEGREEARVMMVSVLLESYSEEELLHDRRFRGLRITPEEIDEAKAWAEEGKEDETDSVETV